jgi:DNA-binding winged helix-turn-helix (wHTH) protein
MSQEIGRARVRVSFGRFVLDRSTRLLLCDGEERHLEPKAFELLDLLLTRRPQAVSKSQIHQRLWPDVFVSESSLTGLVAQIRRALDDARGRPRFIRTLHGFGYAFSGEAAPEPPVETGRGGSAPRVVWEELVIPLKPGENLLGRDEDAAVRVDGPGVSRHHARIVVAGGGATLEDLGSKNGTFLRGQRLEAPTLLRDGETFQLGRQLLVFRSSRKLSSTLTESAGPRRSG